MVDNILRLFPKKSQILKNLFKASEKSDSSLQILKIIQKRLIIFLYKYIYFESV